jgi:hypothetical protein
MKEKTMPKKIEKLDDSMDQKYSPVFYVTQFQDMKTKINEMIDVLNELVERKNAES